jgi:hypothetical protein
MNRQVGIRSRMTKVVCGLWSKKEINDNDGVFSPLMARLDARELKYIGQLGRSST